MFNFQRFFKNLQLSKDVVRLLNHFQGDANNPLFRGKLMTLCRLHGDGGDVDSFFSNLKNSPNPGINVNSKNLYGLKS